MGRATSEWMAKTDLIYRNKDVKEQQAGSVSESRKPAATLFRRPAR
jgi:hypothetical protein